MAEFILVPCGTSLLTNGADEKLRRILSIYANEKDPKSIPDQDLKRILARIEEVKAKLMTSSMQETAKMSAELNSLIKYKNGNFNNKEDYYLLLCTDTWLGENTANLVKMWLQQRGLIVEVYRQKDLQTRELVPFQLALSDLVKYLSEIIPQFKAKGYRIVFNLTGGFKSVQGFLQVLGMFYADTTTYIFESGTELLHIPKLPVELKEIDVVRKNLMSFRKIVLGIAEEQDLRNIPETFILKIDNKVALSPWGEIVWNKAKDQIYGEKIWDPPVERVIFEKGFVKYVEKKFANHTERIKELNERIDDLCIYLLYNKNLKRLRFKPLKGNPIPPYTHEFYPWTGLKDRCYCLYDKTNNTLKITMGDHL